MSSAAATNNLAGDLRADLSAGPVVRGQLRHREGLRDSVTIGTVEKLHQRHRAGSMRLGQAERGHRRERDQSSVGIIGAGPAGLAVADQPAQAAAGRYMSTTATTGSGGLLIYGIPELQIGKGRGGAPLGAAGEPAGCGSIWACRHSALPASDVTLRRAARAARRAIHRHRRLQGARPAGAEGVGMPGRWCRRCDFLTASNRDRASATKCPTSTSGDARTPLASTSWWWAAATRRWTACAPPIRQGAASVKCLYRRDKSTTCRARCARSGQRRGGRACDFAVAVGARRRSRAARMAACRGGARACGCAWALPDSTGRQSGRADRAGIPASSSRLRPGDLGPGLRSGGPRLGCLRPGRS